MLFELYIAGANVILLMWLY